MKTAPRSLARLCLVIGAAQIAFAAPATQPSDFVESVPGDLPIILSAPHGGTLAIPKLKPRGGGADHFVTVTDSHTDQLANALADALQRVAGKRPYLVVAKFDRKFIDANRDRANAFEDPAATPYYDAYHAALAHDCDDVVARFGRGLLIDLHGQGVDDDAIFRGTRNGESVAHLVRDFGDEAVVGPDSVIGQMAKRGYRFIPEPTRDGLGEETRFDGGYLVATYGASGRDKMDAIQLETGSRLRDTAERRQKTADDLAAAIDAYVRRYATKQPVR